MLIKNSITSFLLLLATILLTSCDDGSEQSYEDFQASVPAVCKDYCETKVACEQPSSSGEYKEQSYTSSVHNCIVSCGAIEYEGVYGYQNDTTGLTDRLYSVSVGGDEAFGVLECLYEIGAYTCRNTTSNESLYGLYPSTRAACDASTGCLDDLSLGITSTWIINSDGIGGSCSIGGVVTLDSNFF